MTTTTHTNYYSPTRLRYVDVADNGHITFQTTFSLRGRTLEDLICSRRIEVLELVKPVSAWAGYTHLARIIWRSAPPELPFEYAEQFALVEVNNVL